MNKFLTLLALTLFISGYSQNTKIDTGVYKSRTEGSEILLKLNEDQTFEMTFFHGSYSVENDTIRFNNTSYSNSKFTLVTDKDADFSSKLKLQFEGKLYAYYTSGIFIGTQKNSNTAVEYKRLSEYLEIDEDEELPENLTLEVPKSQFLYLVEQSSEGTEVTKFEVGESLNKVIITYSPYSLANFKLIGYLDSETNKLAISDNKKAVFFTYEKAADFDSQPELKPISIETDSKWATTNGFEEISDNYDYVTSAESYYDFKHKVDISYNDALKTLKQQPSKFLIVSFDLENKDRKTQFDSYLKSSQENISSYMYDAYDESYDLYNFYLATDKDKTLLKKFNISSSKEILVFNDNGELLYHTSGTLQDNSEMLYSYSPLLEALKKANQSLIIDKLIGNNKTSVSELTTGFKNALKITPTYNDYYGAAVTEVEDAAVEIVDDEQVDEAVAASAYADEDYDAIKDKENLYTMKSSLEIVEKQWEKVIDYYSKNNQYNDDFTALLKSELSNEGFISRLFPERKENLSKLDFKLLDYVFLNHEKISASEKIAYETTDTISESYVTYDDNPKDLASILENNVFSYSNTSIEYVEDRQLLEKTMVYFKKYLDALKPSFTAYYQYLNSLTDTSESNELNTNYLDTYEWIYNDIIKKDSSVIESLDANYSKIENDYLSTWADFKSSFAGAGNSAAWHVVENDKENLYLEKAIIWSETSLILDKSSHYYLDTLAQLYYKNGQKDKAIATEQKAIDVTGDHENKTKYEAVLIKMKNGTY